MAGLPLDVVHDLIDRDGGREGSKQMNVFGLDDQIQPFAIQLRHDLGDQGCQACADLPIQDRAAELGTPYQVIVDGIDGLMNSLSVH